MRYALALVKLSQARDHADKIKKQLDMALTPDAPGGIEGWQDTVDASITEAHEASHHLTDLLGDVVVDIEAHVTAQAALKGGGDAPLVAS